VPTCAGPRAHYKKKRQGAKATGDQSTLAVNLLIQNDFADVFGIHADRRNSTTTKTTYHPQGPFFFGSNSTQIYFLFILFFPGGSSSTPLP
jgi:hypothetical protein